MNLFLPILLFAQGIVCQSSSADVSSTSTSTIDDISTTQPVVATPTISVVPPTISESVIETPTVDTSSSVSVTEILTQTTSTVSTTVLSSTTATASSNSSAIDDEAEITKTGTLKPESTEVTEVVPALEIPRELTPDESVAVTALELEVYADLLVNAPLPTLPDDTPEDNIVALPACPVNVATLQKRGLFDGKKAPARPKFYPCMPSYLAIEVIYHYVPADTRVRV
ncbi:hypothetical protein VTL71DRAFT_11275 [Oculimacula yallundae]|uniref:Uncharacterized protein n=1 Tax=Oculimacula yallundae TaxID=86028 RepID=A0ABR4CVL2_9HELO